MIGIVFNEQKLKRVKQERARHEDLLFYFRFAGDHRTKLLFYTPKAIDDGHVNGCCYDWETERITECQSEIPKVNLIRTYISESVYFRLKELERRMKVRFYNLFCGRNKYEMHKLLLAEPFLQPYLPETKLFTRQNLISFLQRYPRVILKPLNGALGERICLLTQKKKGYQLQYIRNRQQFSKRLPSLRSCVQELGRLQQAAYLIQQYIPLQTYQQRIFDIRACVQKKGEGDWSLTGKVLRVASAERIVTNLTQGGEIVPFTRIEHGEQAERALSELCVATAERVEKVYPSAIDLGLDIALDQHHKLWLLEVNYYDQRYAYAQEPEVWEATYLNPLEYVSLFK